MTPTEPGLYWARWKHPSNTETEFIVEISGNSPFFTIRSVYSFAIRQSYSDPEETDPSKLVFGPKITLPNIT